MVATNGPNKRSVLVGAVARESRRRYNYFANLSTLIAHDVLLYNTSSDVTANCDRAVVN